MNAAASKPIDDSWRQGNPVAANTQPVPARNGGEGLRVAMAAGVDAALVLRVLTGANQGAEVRMHAERMLVGNLQSECDVVLDVGHPQRHACLVRASADGWSVLAIAGDLWVGLDHVPLQQTTPLSPDQVLTLGATAFCLGDPSVMDWTTLHIPRNLHEATPAANATSPDQTLNVPGTAKSHWHLAKQVTAVLASLVMLALLVGGYFYLSPALFKPTSASGNSQRVNALRTVLSNQDWSRELTVQVDPDRIDRVLIAGYLSERGQAKELETLLNQQGLSAVHNWTSVAELSRDLSHRLNLKSDSELIHTQDGRFQMRTEYNAFSQYDRLVRRAMQDMPAIVAFDIQLIDLYATDGSGLSVQYQRVGAEIAVTGLDAIRPETEYQIREVRLGALPSVVMSNGARYFEGASLPGNAVLEKIRRDHVVVQTAARQRRIELTTNK